MNKNKSTNVTFFPEYPIQNRIADDFPRSNAHDIDVFTSETLYTQHKEDI